MKTRFLFALFAAGMLTLSARAQSPAVDLAGLLAAIKELQTQQNTVSENQTKIESKVGEVSEQVRLARLYVSRAGGAHKSPP